jgi:charged multivesicular body protein 2A
MAFLFGGGGGKASESKADPVKEYQRELRHAQRSMDREDIKAASQERVLLADIVRQAKDQRLDLCKARARELIRLRSHRARLGAMKGHMTTLGQQLSAVQGAQSMQAIMGKTTRLLQGLNKNMDVKTVHRMLMEYERQSTAFVSSQEVVEETLDSMFEVDGEGEATDEAMLKVFQEIGLDLSATMSSARPALDVSGAESFESRLSRLRVASSS